MSALPQRLRQMADHTGLDAVAELLREAAEQLERTAHGWIPKTQQMPPPGERVFWMDTNTNMVGYDAWAGEDYLWMPTHWMPIPPTPSPRWKEKPNDQQNSDRPRRGGAGACMA